MYLNPLRPSGLAGGLAKTMPNKDSPKQYHSWNVLMSNKKTPLLRGFETLLIEKF